MLCLFTQFHVIALPPSNKKSFILYDGFGKSALLWSFEPRNFSGVKLTYGMAAVFKKRYFLWLRGIKEGQECASLEHLEFSSMSSGERQRKSRGTLKEQDRYKRYSIGRAEAHKRDNRWTEDAQQRYKR